MKLNSLIKNIAQNEGIFPPIEIKKICTNSKDVKNGSLFIAIDGELFNAALTLTINSGNEVAKDTTVIPITNFDILNFKDKATDDLTINSPPITSKKKPKKISIKFIYLIIILCLVTLELFEIFNT